MDRKQILKMISQDDQKSVSSLLASQSAAKENLVSADVLNIIETWIHNLLYYKNIYPKEAFEPRSIYGIEVFIAKSTLLKQYLDQFIEDISYHIHNISFIRVRFIAADQIEIQTSKLNLFISDSISQQFIENDRMFDSNIEKINTIQKQIQYKKFISEMRGAFIQGFERKQGQQIKFKIDIGYRMQELQGLRKQKVKLIQDWTKIEDTSSKNAQIINSLKSDRINFIYEVIRNRKN